MPTRTYKPSPSKDWLVLIGVAFFIAVLVAFAIAVMDVESLLHDLASLPADD